MYVKQIKTTLVMAALGVIVLTSKADAQKSELEQAVSMSNPVPSASVTLKFGRNTNPLSGELYFHEGVDLAAKTGTNIHAPMDGKIEMAAEDYKERKGSGRSIIINHGNGIKTYFYHLDAIKVKQGALVKRDDVIGTLGATGEGSGPHVHFEVRKNGRAIDPSPLISQN